VGFGGAGCFGFAGSGGLVAAAAALAPALAGRGCAFDLQPGGGTTSTMLPHFGQVRICPIAASLRTFSRAWQVRQLIANRVRSTASPIRWNRGARRRKATEVRSFQF
jgi:hypothetical protein